MKHESTFDLGLVTLLWLFPFSTIGRVRQHSYNPSEQLQSFNVEARDDKGEVMSAEGISKSYLQPTLFSLVHLESVTSRRLIVHGLIERRTAQRPGEQRKTIA